MAENQSGAARMAQALRRSERLRLSGGAVRFSSAVEPTTPAAVQPRQIPGGSGRVGSLVVAVRVQAPLRTGLSTRAAQHSSPFRQPLFSCAKEETQPIPHGGGSEARQRFCAAGISGSGNAVCFMTMSRPISILLLPTTDLTADPDSAAHCVTVTRQHVKTDHGIDRNQPGRFPLSFPRRFAGLATALRNFTAARAAVYPTATHFFELPGERFTEKTNFGDALGRMLGTALTTVSLQPPEGRVYTARSLRSGGASDAEMVPLPRSKSSSSADGPWTRNAYRHYISRARRYLRRPLFLRLADLTARR
ncbi:core-binding (CB) domain-containing protein [Pycnococcus provasolii]